MKKVCFFNQSSVHYRSAIYELMDNELQCDFYFGDSRPGNILPYENAKLKNFAGTLKNIRIGPFYWQKGAISLLKKPYKYLLTPGDTYCLSTWVIFFLSKLFYKKKKVFVWAHGAYGEEGWIKRRIINLKYWLIDGAFLYGNRAKNILQQYGVPERKLHLIYNSLDYDKQKELRCGLVSSDVFRRHFNNSNNNIIFIGRLTKVKKLHMILEAVSLCKSQGIMFNVTFIGDGPERSTLEQLVDTLSLKHQVWFYGACYNEGENAELIYNADLCVSPGNVGLTAMHSLMFGTPVITHNHFAMQMPEFEAIEEGVSGAFFKENDSNDLSLVLSSWVTSNKDRNSIRQVCYNIMDTKYNPHKQIEILINTLQ